MIFGIKNGKAQGLQNTGICGIQDTRQIIDGKTKDKENNGNKAGHSLVSDTIKQLMIKAKLQSPISHVPVL